MGKLFTKSSDVGNMVREKFGTADNYLVAVKHNSILKGFLEWLLSNLFYILTAAGRLFSILMMREYMRKN